MTTENEIKSLLGHVHPKPVYHLLQDKIDDRFYVILAVEPGNDGPYETDQRAEKDKKINLKAGRYIRIRRDSRMPNRTEEFELLRRFAEFHFSSELNREATLDDLNYEYMKEYLVRTNAAADIRNLTKLEMAEALHLIDSSQYGGYRAKNFAVLMFAERPADFIPYAYVRIIREVKGTDKMESKIFDGPVWIQAQQVREYFRDNIMSTYTVREPGVSGAHRVSNWPLEMFEELATNCILHKHCFAQMVFCGDCGEFFRRVHWNNRGCKSVVWRCVSRLENTGHVCRARTVNEEYLQEVVIQAINQVLCKKDDFLKALQTNIATVIKQGDTLSPEVIDERLRELQKELLKKANQRDDYDAIANEILRLRDMRKQAEVDSVVRDEQMRLIRDLQDFIRQQPTTITDFDETLVKRLITKITVFEDHFTIDFKSGITIDIEA